MSDRIHSFLVVLKEDMKDEDAELLRRAIGLFEDVISVEPVKASVNSQMSEARAKHELRMKLIDLV